MMNNEERVSSTKELIMSIINERIWERIYPDIEKRNEIKKDNYLDTSLIDTALWEFLEYINYTSEEEKAFVEACREFYNKDEAIDDLLTSSLTHLSARIHFIFISNQMKKEIKKSLKI